MKNCQQNSPKKKKMWEENGLNYEIFKKSSYKQNKWEEEMYIHTYIHA